MPETKSETEQIILPKLTGKSFKELPTEEQEVLEAIAGGLSRKAKRLGIDFEESLLSKMGRTKKEKEEYQATLESLEKKGLVTKTESDESTSYNLTKENRDFLESELREK